MNLLGIHLTLLIGRTVPTPASPFLVENLRSVEVTQRDAGPSGFQMTFHVGRSSAIDLLDYRLLTNPALKPFSRVVIVVRFAIAPVVLIDGIITNQQLSPGSEPGASTLTVTGEDVSVMMDLEQVQRAHPAMPDNLAVMRLLAPYIGRFLLIPRVLPPANLQPSNPIQRVPQQPTTSTDRAYIQMLAQRHGHVFYVEPGPTPLSNIAYWGPPNRLDIPQGALSVNMGPSTNVDSINFNYNGLAANKVTFVENSSERTISSPSATRIQLARNRAELRRTVFLAERGPNAEARAQGQVDRSLDEVVTATGELDALRYNGALKPRGLVGLRGAGQSYDGQYYVKSVTSKLSKGQFKQSFTLTREGTGALLPIVRP